MPAQALGFSMALPHSFNAEISFFLTVVLMVYHHRASPSNDIVSSAFSFCRKKGRVVLVGDVGLNLNRDDFYLKELDFFISSSYGPGRYDSNYEELGLDYPIGYVRWTENRNMAEYIRLISINKVSIDPLISNIYNVSDIESAY